MPDNKTINVAKNIEKKIFNKVETVVLEKVAPIAEEKLDEVIDEIVYDGEFQPYGKNPYKRREDNGGYGDSNLIETNIIVEENKITLVTTNKAVGAGDEAGERLDEIIEYGEKYGWYHVPPPRPVFATVKEEIRNSKDKIIEEIKNTLNTM